MPEIYLAKNINTFSGKKLETEFISQRICVNPKYPSVKVHNPNTLIMIDSGAFQDRKKDQRISFDEALNRQLKLENKIGIICEKIVAYDQIGNIEETIEANKFLSGKREPLLQRQPIFVLQGNTENEYLQCFDGMLDFIKKGDCVGFGGIAKAGTNGEVKKILYNIMPIILNKMIPTGVDAVHFFGLTKIQLMKEISELFKNYEKSLDVKVTFDSSTAEVMAIFGKELCIEHEKFYKAYKKEEKFVSYHPCDLAHTNMNKMVEVVRSL
jgi:hypothetical protein